MPKTGFLIEKKSIRDKYDSLVEKIGKPTYIEIDNSKKLNSATWMKPRKNFNNQYGAYGGCDYIKIYGFPAKKYHPHPADVLLIVGKYLHVPEHLFGPLKYASETINIEQLFIPDDLAEKYFSTGKKEKALVTGSCASVTISVITIKFVEDMIEKYKNEQICLEKYNEFRTEYDDRIHDYLCGNGITTPIPWYNPADFDEPDKYTLNKKTCDDRKIEIYNYLPNY